MQGSVLAGRYRLEDLLGAGGMGQVWRGTDQLLHRKVAVKLLARPGDRVLATRLLAEARAAAAFSDPHAVAVHDVGEGQLGGVPSVFLVMELVEGRSLSELLHDGPLPVDDVLRWGEEICQALEAAHRAGVVHRDVKPSNVLITAAGRMKLCDFGIARRALATQGLTATGSAIGTPGYMAPEQIRGDTVGPTTDLYAVGCLLYELLTGRPPFTGEALSVLSKHLEQTPVPIRDLRPEVPAALDRLVGQLLAKDPARRPVSAALVGDELLDAGRGSVAPRMLPPGRNDAAADPSADTQTAAAAIRSEVDTRAPKWGRGRAALVLGALCGTDLVFLADMSVLWASMLGVLAAGLVSLLYDDGADLPARRGQQVRESGGTLLLALAVTGVVAVVLLFWSPAPWWVALLTLMAGGPLLFGGASGIAGLLTRLRGTDQQTDMAAGVGLVNGTLAALLVSPEQGLVALGLGVGAWLATAAVTALLMPTIRRA
ncbi:protein kinase domain-containing protein [Streptomyces virginiae]|uniref:protein kinase domain-containing protein n=1 Tax=Streptomyces virginiae TaxID=1961 RepID=UPI002F91B20B|nr:protein kinase [Streptomyces virginiae]